MHPHEMMVFPRNAGFLLLERLFRVLRMDILILCSLVAAGGSVVGIAATAVLWRRALTSVRYEHHRRLHDWSLYAEQLRSQRHEASKLIAELQAEIDEHRMYVDVRDQAIAMLKEELRRHAQELHQHGRGFSWGHLRAVPENEEAALG
jgi:signal transduction histidine kinase